MGYTKEQVYTLTAMSGAVTNPADATVYYFGSMLTQALDTTSTWPKIYITQRGVIRKITMYSTCATAAGTGEDWAWLVRLNDATDHVISTTGAAATYRTWENLNMNVPVVPGDFVMFKTTTPNWVTNPEGFRVCAVIYIEY